MSRPRVSVVVPFSGDVAQALMALALVRSLRRVPGDEVIVADNCGAVPEAEDVTVVRAAGERSAAHARNAGAARAEGDWILFLDADVQAPAELLDLYFAGPVASDVGALVGEVTPAPGGRGLVARYGAARNFLSQSAHMSHPFRPRAAAANLLVRREAFVSAGGFREGLRAAEDTDFCWRLQDLGWRLELRPGAEVRHVYRTTLAELRRQWRGYAAGRAWLAREYPGFEPEPAVTRALRRVSRRTPAADRLLPGRAGAPAVRDGASAAVAAPRGAPRSRRERLGFLAIDVILAIEELVGFRMSNRPGAHG